jgi:hypothetical protein
MSQKIIFKSYFKNYIPEPTPSLIHLPEHYKKLKSFMNDSISSVTVKKCIPFLDALTVGYIIPFPVDIRFRYDQKEEKVVWELSDVLSSTGLERNLKPMSHENFQMPNELRYPNRTVEAVFKWMNLWRIETPPGYSCIFTQPFNRVSNFKIIDGIVDTDSFDEVINFPFFWTTPVDKPVVVKMGSPMALVIPFRREKWKMNTELMPFDAVKADMEVLKRMSKIFDNYKTKFWNKKEYR